MSTTEIIWVIALALVVIVLIGLAGYVLNTRKTEQNRARAEHLRIEADSNATVIPDAQVRAHEAEVRAERAHLDAERAEEDAARANQGVDVEQARYEDRMREADRLDPDVDHRSTGYAPDTSVVESERSTYDAGGRVEPQTATSAEETDSDGPVDGREGSRRA